MKFFHWIACHLSLNTYHHKNKHAKEDCENRVHILRDVITDENREHCWMSWMQNVYTDAVLIFKCSSPY
jgi:hypothetical protein